MVRTLASFRLFTIVRIGQLGRLCDNLIGIFPVVEIQIMMWAWRTTEANTELLVTTEIWSLASSRSWSSGDVLNDCDSLFLWNSWRKVLWMCGLYFFNRTQSQSCKRKLCKRFYNKNRHFILDMFYFYFCNNLLLVAIPKKREQLVCTFALPCK